MLLIPYKTMVSGGCLILEGRGYFTKVSEELMCFFPWNNVNLHSRTGIEIHQETV